MTRQKTLLSAQAQWERTAAYYQQLYAPYGPTQVDARTRDPCVFHGAHALASDGDVLFVTEGNGMGERYGMTGITSKGAKLVDFHLPLRRGFGWLRLPDEFIGRQWTDPGIGRCVADLRASFRSRVSANSPATSHCMTLAGIDTSEIAFNGLYKSARLPASTKVRDHRHYLRFYPDGSVTQGYEVNHDGRRLSFEPDAPLPTPNPHVPQGRLTLRGTALSVDLFRNGAVLEACYEGKSRAAAYGCAAIVRIANSRTRPCLTAFIHLIRTRSAGATDIEVMPWP